MEHTINLHVVDSPITAPSTGFVAKNSLDTTQDWVIVAGIVAVLILVSFIVFLCYRRKHHKTMFATIAMLTLVIAISMFSGAKAVSGTPAISLIGDDIDITISKTDLATEAPIQLAIHTENSFYDIRTKLLDLSDDRINISVNDLPISDTSTTTVASSTETEQPISVTVEIDDSLPVGDYSATIQHILSEPQAAQTELQKALLLLL